jgi:hypothetical protein
VCAPHRRFARVHLDRLGDRAGLIRELLERELKLPRVNAFGLLAEEPLTEHIELMAQRRDFALRPRELLLEDGDEGARGGEVLDVGIDRAWLTHQRILRSPRRQCLP